ncbi:hypothetical protein U1Q18_050933, partial [Sarracenia purpurea var. burkii]
MLSPNIKPSEFTIDTMINSSIVLHNPNSSKQPDGSATKIGIQSNVLLGSTLSHHKLGKYDRPYTMDLSSIV